MLRTCTQCQRTLETTEFWNSRGKPRAYCRGCDSERRKAFSQANPGYFAAKTKASVDKRQAWLRGVKDTPCADCGKRYPFYVMDFDHKADKIFNIGSGRGIGLEKLKAEVAKCDVVCSNCHRERSHKRRSEA